MTNGNYSALISCPTGWHEYSVNIDTVAGTYSIYLDGALVESRAGVTFPASYGNALTVGASGYAQMDLAEIQMFSDAPIDNVKSRQLYEDTYGWVENRANPHCKDISDQYPLGTDRVSSSGLVLALDMETLTTDGKLKDFSGNGNHATISGAKYQRGAIKNGAYSFSAATDSVNTGITADYGSVTYAFWIRPTNFSSTYDVFGKDAGDNITIEATTGKVQFTSNGTVKATNGLTAGKTAFVVVKVNGSAVTIKVNDTANGSGNVTGRTTSSNPYKLGKFTSTALVGTIGPIFVFGGLTTDSQDTNLFYDSQKMLGLVQGGTTNINVPGQVGQAVDLNGTSQYIEVQDCPALNPAQITAGAWVNQDNASTYPTVIAKLNGNYGFQLFQYIAGKTTFFKGGNGTAISQNESGTTWNFGKWAFIAGIYDGTNVYGFVDGAIGTGTSLSALSHANVPLQIGRGSSSGNYVDGRIAFPFIFNRALSAAEFARLRYLGLSARW